MEQKAESLGFVKKIQNLFSPVVLETPEPKEEVNEVEFKSNGILTLGVEVEFQLIDLDTGNLSNKADEILAKAEAIQNDKIKPEFYQSTVEINTGKCNNVQEVEEDLGKSFSDLHKITKEVNIGLSTTGSHPFAHYTDSKISETDRYQELIDRNQWLTRRMTVYGLHVHIGMATGDDCIRFNNFFMNFVPHLLALSASSPFWQGIDTGLSSCRPTTYEALPTAGQPYHVKTWKEFERLYESLKKCDSIHGLKDLWWDMRPSPHYGTLEIRVCDGCATLSETLAIVAFIHSLASWFQENGEWLEQVQYPLYWISRENKWRVIRHGLEANIVLNAEGKTKILRDDLDEWLEKLKPHIQKLGYERYIATLKEIIQNGTSSQRQLEVYQKTQDLRDVVFHNIKEFEDMKPHWVG